MSGEEVWGTPAEGAAAAEGPQEVTLRFGSEEETIEVIYDATGKSNLVSETKRFASENGQSQFTILLSLSDGSSISKAKPSDIDAKAHTIEEITLEGYNEPKAC